MAALREDDNKVHAMIDSIKSEPASLVVMCCSPAIAIQTESKLLGDGAMGGFFVA